MADTQGTLYDTLQNIVVLATTPTQHLPQHMNTHANSCKETSENDARRPFKAVPQNHAQQNTANIENNTEEARF